MRTSEGRGADMVVLAQCGRCANVQGLYLVLEGGTLRLGRQGCQHCGFVGSPVNCQLRGHTIPQAETSVEVDDELHVYPEVAR